MEREGAFRTLGLIELFRTLSNYAVTILPATSRLRPGGIISASARALPIISAGSGSAYAC